MATKIKGFCKGSFKYISQIFVVKEREMEIGYPTDVKHVAHIGWGGPDGTTPTWMNEYKSGSDLAVGSIVSIGGSRDPTWTSQDFDRTFGQQSSSAMLSNISPVTTPNATKKQKPKKVKSTSTPSPKSSSSRSYRLSKSRSMMKDPN